MMVEGVDLGFSIEGLKQELTEEKILNVQHL